MRLSRRSRSASDQPVSVAGRGVGPRLAPLDEIAALTLENRARRDAGLERRLVGLRHDAFAGLPHDPSPVWPPVFEDPFPGLTGRPPEIEATELTAEIAGGAIRHHGCLLVRGLFSADHVARLVEDTDRVFRSREDALAGTPASPEAAWYEPFVPGPDAPALTDGQRRWVRDCGAVWVADSPAATFDVFEGLYDARIPQIVSEYLGEPTALSVNKCTLRRVAPEASGAWHQDGSFLGEGVRTMSVWVALSECGDGTNSPGLTIVPRRIARVLPVDVETGSTSISVGIEGIVEALAGLSPVRPTFAAGDALLFDEVFVHRTGGTEGTTRPRYALESWFFTPGTFPPSYVPLVV